MRVHSEHAKEQAEADEAAEAAEAATVAAESGIHRKLHVCSSLRMRQPSRAAKAVGSAAHVR